MSQHSTEGRSFRCLVCAAGVGQLVPFCEWCGAKHAFSGGQLVLTGAICQECGFQSAAPTSRCPQCRALRRILCPACATALAVRQTCIHCGLHFMFFDKVRREHSRAYRHPRAARMSMAARKLIFLIFVLAVALPLCMGPDARWFALGFVFSAIGASAVGSGMVRLPRLRWGRQAGRDLVTVLETCDPAEAMAGRAWLRLSGIEAQTVAVSPKGAGSYPPGGLRRIMVARLSAARALACLADHGFEVSRAARNAPSPPARAGLRLVHNGTARRERPQRDHD